MKLYILIAVIFETLSSSLLTKLNPEWLAFWLLLCGISGSHSEVSGQPDDVTEILKSDDNNVRINKEAEDEMNLSDRAIDDYVANEIDDEDGNVNGINTDRQQRSNEYAEIHRKNVNERSNRLVDDYSSITSSNDDHQINGEIRTRRKRATLDVLWKKMKLAKQEFFEKVETCGGKLNIIPFRRCKLCQINCKGSRMCRYWRCKAICKREAQMLRSRECQLGRKQILDLWKELKMTRKARYRHRNKNSRRLRTDYYRQRQYKGWRRRRHRNGSIGQRWFRWRELIKTSKGRIWRWPIRFNKNRRWRLFSNQRKDRKWRKPYVRWGMLSRVKNSRVWRIPTKGSPISRWNWSGYYTLSWYNGWKVWKGRLGFKRKGRGRIRRILNSRKSNSRMRNRQKKKMFRGRKGKPSKSRLGRKIKVRKEKFKYLVRVYRDSYRKARFGQGYRKLSISRFVKSKNKASVRKSNFIRQVSRKGGKRPNNRYRLKGWWRRAMKRKARRGGN